MKRGQRNLGPPPPGGWSECGSIWTLGIVGLLAGAGLISQRRRGSRQVLLGTLVTTKKRFPDADFWLSPDGTPTRTFKNSLVGIKVTRTDVLLPDYLFYVFEYLKGQGLWQAHPVTPQTVRSIPVQPTGGANRGSRSGDDSPRFLIRAGGDVDPFNYGGGWVIMHPDGSLGLIWIHGLDATPDNEIAERLEGIVAMQQGEDLDDALYRLGLELEDVWPYETYHVSIEDDVFADHTWVDVAGLARSWGSPEVTEQTLREWGRSPNPLDRALAIETIASHHGWHELDHYPIVSTGAEIKQRWPELDGAPGERPTLPAPKGRRPALQQWARWDRQRQQMKGLRQWVPLRRSIRGQR